MSVYFWFWLRRPVKHLAWLQLSFESHHASGRTFVVRFSIDKIIANVYDGYIAFTFVVAHLGFALYC